MCAILRHKLAMHNEKNVKIPTGQFVPNFVGYVSAKYCLNWFTAEKAIAKTLRVNFFETQCISQNDKITLFLPS